MALPNGYAQYNNSKILTASPAELTLMLYDGAIKFANIAVMGMEQNDIQKAHNNIIRVQRIIEEFRNNLLNIYPAFSHFYNINICVLEIVMYLYLLKRLYEANVKKDKEIMEEVLTHLRSMRDTWIQVMKANKVRGVV